MRKRIFLIFLLFIAVLSPYFIIPIYQTPPEESALKSFSEENYLKTKKALSRLPKDTPESKKVLFKGYLARGQGNLKASNEWFQKAHSNEAQINLALNAYLEKDLKTLATLLGSLKSNEQTQAWGSLFNGWLAYQSENWPLAKEQWKEVGPLNYLSPWMRVSFNRYIGNDWIPLHLSAIKIETGDVQKARRALSALHGNPIQNLRSYLISRSYYLEAKNKVGPAAMPFYRLALTHLGKVSKEDPLFIREKKHLVPELEAFTTQFIKDEKINKNSVTHIIFLIQTLQNWKEKKALDSIQKAIQEHLQAALQQEEIKRGKYLATLIPLFPTNSFDATLPIALETIKKLIQQKKFQEANTIWTWTKKYSEETKAPTILTLSSLLPDVANNEDALKLWLTTNPSIEDQNHLASEIELSLFSNWKKEGGHEKVENLLSLLSLLPKEQETLKHSIQKMANASFQEENWTLLPTLFQFAKKMNLDDLARQSDEEIQAILSKNKKPSLPLIKWIYLQKPHDPIILTKLADAEYNHENYKEALALFSKIEEPDESTKKSFLITQTILGNHSINDLEGLSDEDWFRLSTGLYSQGKTSSALDALENIKKNSSKKTLLLSYFLTQQNNWKEAQALLSTLSSWPANTLLILTESHLKQTENAEKRLSTWTPNPSNNSFIENELSFWTKHALQTYLFFYGENDAEKALASFENKLLSDPQTALLKSKILMSLNLPSDAIKTLSPFAKNLHNPLPIQKNISLDLASAFFELKRDYDSFLWFEYYYSLPEPSNHYRALFAEVLSNVRLWKKALQQYELSSTPTPTQLIHKSWALIHINQFEKARKEALGLRENKDLTTIETIELARLLLFLSEGEKGQKLLVNIPKLSELSSIELTKLLLYYRESAQYPKALEFVHATKKKLLETIEGKIALVEFDLQLSRKAEALELITKATSNYPTSSELQKFLLDHPPNFVLVNQLSETINKRLKKEPHSLSLRISFITAMIQWIVAADLEGKTENKLALVEKQELLSLTDLLIRRNSDLPLLWHLKGKANLLIGNKKRAAKNFAKARSLDPSFALATKDYSRTLLQLGKIKKAAKLIRKAIKYAPYDSQAWSLLALLEAQLDRYEEATKAYKQAIRYAPGVMNNYVNLALLFLRMKNPESAVDILKVVSKLTPDSPEVHALLIQALYDPLLFVEDTALLQQEREKAFDHLKELAPPLAEKIEVELILPLETAQKIPKAQIPTNSQIEKK